MNLKINKKKFITTTCYIVYVLISLVCVLELNTLGVNQWLANISYVIISNFILQIFFAKILKIKLFSISVLFVVLLYLFHFGQLLVAGLFPLYQSYTFDYISILDLNYLKETTFICIFFIDMFFLGIVISNKNNKYMILEINSEYEKQQLSVIRKIGWIMFVFSFPIEVCIDFVKLLGALSGGYSAAIDSTSSIPGVVGALGNFMFTAIGILLIGYKNNTTKAKNILYLVVAYCLIMMFTGNRGHQVAALIAFSYIANKTFFKVSAKKALFVVLIIFLGITFLNIIFVSRSNGIYYIVSNFPELVENQLEKSMILETLASFGGTIYTPYLVVTDNIIKSRQISYGLTYLYSLASILPDVGIFTDINSLAIFQKALNGSALGGSVIGELFYNFKYFGSIFAVLIGILINKFSMNLEKYLFQKEYIKAIFYLPILFNILWWVRGCFTDMVRPVVWQWVFIWILLYFYDKKKKRLYYH